jgi:glutamate racemase
MNFSASQPIGILDSGVGGLTVAHALTTLLPQEKLIYFGDVAHHPYGEKSQAAIQAYVVKICEMLLKQKVKLIIIACNSASAAAYELAKEYVGSKAKIVDVIEPAINYIRENFSQRKMGLIGTRQTINSNVYLKKIDALNKEITLSSLATPLLAPMIEEGHLENAILSNVLESYLSQPALENIDALLLACTHYPLIKKQIQHYYQAHNRGHIALIDNAEITARAAKGLLEHHHLLNASPNPTHHFYVSDYTESFVATARYFFTQPLHFEHYPLWE